jgi:hypothetical protein
MRDRISDAQLVAEIAEVIADELAAKQIHLSNQSVASQVRNGAFEGLTISETEEWNEYLDSLSQFSDENEILWDDVLLADPEEIDDGNYSPNVPASWKRRNAA